ncbi:antigen like protein, partial [Clarias magur]
MEMIEEIYANAEVTEDKRADSRDGGNSYEDVYANQDNLETQKTRNFKESETSVFVLTPFSVKALSQHCFP